MKIFLINIIFRSVKILFFGETVNKKVFQRTKKSVSTFAYHDFETDPDI